MEREIIDLTDSNPSTPKKSQPERARPTVTSAESKTSCHPQQQRSNKLAPRKLVMSDVSSVPQQQQQVPRSQNVQGQPQNPTEQTRNRPDENSIVRSAIAEKYRYQQPPPINDINKYCVYYMRGKLSKDQWTEKEHELFLMGLIRYGKGSWSKIARDFVTSKTPHQVFKYGVNFFKRLPTTCLYTFNFKKSWEQPTSATSIARARIFDPNQKPQTNKPRKATPVGLPRGSSSSSPLPKMTTMRVGGSAVPTITVTAEAVPSKPKAPDASSSNMVMTMPPAEPPQTLILFPVEAPLDLFPLSAAPNSINTSVAAAANNEPEAMDVDCTLALARNKGPDADDDDDLNLDLTLGHQGT